MQYLNELNFIYIFHKEVLSNVVLLSFQPPPPGGTSCPPDSQSMAPPPRTSSPPWRCPPGCSGRSPRWSSGYPLAATRAELRTNLLLKGESIAEDKNNGEYLLSTMIPSPCSGSSHILSSQLQPKPPLCRTMRVSTTWGRWSAWWYDAAIPQQNLICI